MTDTVLSSDVVQDARVSLRARADALYKTREYKTRTRRIDRFHAFSSALTLVGMFGVVGAGLLTIFAAMAELVGHPGMLAFGALLPAAVLTFVLLPSGIVNTAYTFVRSQYWLYPGVSEAEIADILAGAGSIHVTRESIIRANTASTLGEDLTDAVRNIPLVLAPLALSVPLWLIGFGVIVGPLAWVIIGALALVWFFAALLTIGLTFFAN